MSSTEAANVSAGAIRRTAALVVCAKIQSCEVSKEKIKQQDARLVEKICVRRINTMLQFLTVG